MVSTNTPLNGASHRNNTLIFQQNSAKHHKAIEKTASFSSISQNSLLTRLVLLLLMFFSISFFTNVNAQCTPLCGSTITIQLSANANGHTPLAPQTFYTGNCGVVTVSPTFVDCSNIGTPVPITLTSNTVPGLCSGSPIMVMVVDQSAPVITCPADVTIDCAASSAPSNTGSATASDNCMAVLPPGNISFADVAVASTGVGNCGSIDRTWTATDNAAAPNSSTCLQTITITDSNAPTLDFSPGTAPADVTVDCQSSIPAQVTFTGMDDCGFTTSVTDVPVGQGTDPNMCDFYNYTVNRTYAVTDNCGNTDQHTQVITFDDNVDPVIPAQTSTLVVNPGTGCTASVSLSVTASDNCAAPANLQGFFEVKLQSSGAVVANGGGLNASGTYNVGLYDFEFTVIDPCGNNHTEVYEVNVMDSGNPTARCKANVTVSVDSQTGMSQITTAAIDDNSTDTCTPQNLLTFSIVRNDATGGDKVFCGEIGTMIPVTLTVTDGNGNSNTCSSMVEPTASNPTAVCTDISVNLDATGNYTYSAADLTALQSGFTDVCSTTTPPLSFTYSQSSFTCADIGANTVMVTATNSFGKMTSCNSIVTVTDMTPPVQSCAASYNAYLNENGELALDPRWLLSGAYEIYMTSGDNGSGTNGFTEYALTSPNGASFSFDWGYVTNDTRGATEDRLWYRIDANAPVILKDNSIAVNTGTESITMLAGETLRIRLDTRDNMGGRSEVNLSNFSTSLGTLGDLYKTNWVSRLVRSDGVAFISGNAIETMDCTSEYDLIFSSDPAILTCDSIPSTPVKIYATDAFGNIDSCTTTVTVIDNMAPDFECADFTAQLDQGGNVVVEPGWFLDGARSLFLESSDNGSYPTVGTVDHTVRVKSAGNIQFRWDFESADTTNTGEVFGYVLNGVFTQLSSLPIHNNVFRSVAVNAGDIFGFRIQSDNNTFNSYASVRPNGTSFTFTNDYDPVLWTKVNTNNNGSCFIHGSLSDNCSGLGDLNLTINSAANLTYDCSITFPGTPVAVTINITDSASPANSKSCSANLHIIDNEPPIAVCPSSYTVTLGSNGEVDLSVLPSTTNIVNNSIDNCAGALMVTPNPLKLTCADIGVNTISYTVTDASGNTATCTNTITAQEGTAPQISCPADIIVQCENLPADTLTNNAGMATATDNCSATTITYLDAVVTGANCVDIERTWTAVDGSMNASSCIQKIGIQDLVAPTLTLPTTFATPIAAECGAVPAPPTVTYMDNCTAILTFDSLDSRIDTINGVDTFLVLPSASAFYNYTITREWKVVDACGSTATQGQVVNVTDSQMPVVTFPTSLVLNTDAGVCQTNVGGLSLKSSDVSDCAAFQYLTITNNSAYATSSGADASGIYPLGITTVTFTITDPSGNAANHVITIEVKDVETPNMNCEDDFDVVLSSAGAATISVINVDEGSNDACGLASLSINPTMFDCTDVGLNVVTLTGVDNNGNVGTCTTTVDVQTNATSSVTISCPANITIACPTVPNPSVTGTALFTSACGTGSLSHTDNPLSSPSCGTILRTWTITDGTTSQACVQTITMADSNAPTLMTGVTVPTYPVQECMVPAIDQLMYEDDCKGNFAVTPTDTRSAAYDADPAMCGHYNYNITRTWVAMDDCGNSAAAVNRTIQVRDTEAPVLSFPTPLVIPTDANACTAAINVDLKDYVTDCADDAFLSFSIDGATGGNSVISGTYGIGTHSFTLEVSDPCTNSTGVVTINIEVEDQQTPTAVCIQNVVIVLDNTGNATINANDVDAGSTDNCTTIPNLIRTVSPSAFTTADVGPVQITLTVEDEANLTNSCIANGTVVGGTLFDAADVSLPVASMGTVPVTVSNFQNVTSFAFNVDVVDATVATVNSLSNVNPALAANGTFTTSATTNGYSVIWTATAATSPITLTDGDVLFEVDVTAIGNAADMSVVDITANTVMKLIGGVATPDASTALDGSITLFDPTTTHTFDVELNTEEGAPVANADVVQTGGNTNTIVSNTTGDAFGFTAPSGTTTTFTPSKNTGWKNGVTVNDAFLVLQHPNPTSTFGSGYKNIAADANGDNIITGNDAILIFQLAVDPAMTSIPGNTSWRFIHETPNLSTTASPWGLFSESYTTTVATNELVKFIGVKTGDVDADANALLRQNGTFEFLLENQSIENTGERVEVEFKTKDFNGINGYQYTIDFESKLLEYVDVIPGVLPNLSSFNFKDAKAADGQLTTGYINMDAVSLNDNDVLFTLVFESKAADFELKDAISASDNLIPMQVIESTGELKNEVELVFESSTSSTVNTFENNLDLRQNVPNPFDSETIVGFTLPGATAVQLNFMDASGKLLHTIDSDYPQGYHEVTVSKEVLPTTGIVFYQLQTEFGTKVQKMIILE